MIKFFVRRDDKSEYQRQYHEFPLFENEIKGKYFNGTWHQYRIEKKVKEGKDMKVYATLIPNDSLLYQ